MIIVTGGAGFIGSNFIHRWLRNGDEAVCNIDCLTYAGNLDNLAGLPPSRTSEPTYHFSCTDICDQAALTDIFAKHRPRAIVHFAAESHVDRSIHGPAEFIRTNVNGTFALLEAAKDYFQQLRGQEADAFRFLHVSTDEVFGSLSETEAPFSESSAYSPNSPYSASKAASDHLVRAYFHTFGLPTITTNCSNNYGPYQFPEKLIPLVVSNALDGQSLPIYGDGKNVRDWLYVADHCDAIMRVLEQGRVGETYNIGGLNERTNLEVVHEICRALDGVRPKRSGRYCDQIVFVKDRPGHDRRYAIDARKISRELSWRPTESFESGLRKTVLWYLENQSWVNRVKDGSYREWIDRNYAGAAN